MVGKAFSANAGPPLILSSVRCWGSFCWVGGESLRPRLDRRRCRWRRGWLVLFRTRRRTRRV